jgi:hypothetical protein
LCHPRVETTPHRHPALSPERFSQEERFTSANMGTHLLINPIAKQLAIGMFLSLHPTPPIDQSPAQPMLRGAPSCRSSVAWQLCIAYQLGNLPSMLDCNSIDDHGGRRPATSDH